MSLQKKIVWQSQKNIEEKGTPFGLNALLLASIDKTYRCLVLQQLPPLLVQL